MVTIVTNGLPEENVHYINITKLHDTFSTVMYYVCAHICTYKCMHTHIHTYIHIVCLYIQQMLNYPNPNYWYIQFCGMLLQSFLDVDMQSTVFYVAVVCDVCYIFLSECFFRHLAQRVWVTKVLLYEKYMYVCMYVCTVFIRIEARASIFYK